MLRRSKLRALLGTVALALLCLQLLSPAASGGQP